MDKLKYSIVIAIFALLGFQKTEFTSQGFENTQKYVNDTLTWKKLGQIKFIKKQHKDYGMVDFPLISPEVKIHNNKKVFISGFIVPIDNVNYAVSKNVFASCFFCGKAGPETIMGIKFKAGKMKLRTDQYVTLSGILKVNETDVDNWMYNIEDAVIVKGN